MPLLRLSAWDKVRAGSRLPWTTAVGTDDSALSMLVRSVCCELRKLSAVASAVIRRGYVINESTSSAGQALPSERSVMAFHSGGPHVRRTRSMTDSTSPCPFVFTPLLLNTRPTTL